MPERKEQLTQKMENFCLAYIEKGTGSEAYRQSYDCENSSTSTVYHEARLLLMDDRIIRRIEELRSEQIDKHHFSIDKLMSMHIEAYDVAKLAVIPSAMISASKEITKLSGLASQGKIKETDELMARIEALENPDKPQPQEENN